MRRPLLMPLVPLYGAVLGLKRRFFEREPRRLVHAVISVGSLSAGGAGKTPVVVALVELLTREGYAVDVLSRGYGRRSNEVGRVDPGATAARFGDEPLELARRTGAAVYVGASRYAAGMLAEREADPATRLMHVLDDGFQHRKLARDLDLVLLTKEDVEDTLLPAGNLREPLDRLRNADVVVVREDEVAIVMPHVLRLVEPQGSPTVWVVRRRLELPAGDPSQKPLAFCGLARPEGFFSMLRDKGLGSAATVAFRDHHPYTYRDVTGLTVKARRAEADGFVTTEKDAVKLSAVMRRRLEEVGPLMVARLRVDFVEERATLEQIIGAAANRIDRMRR